MNAAGTTHMELEVFRLVTRVVICVGHGNYLLKLYSILMTKATLLTISATGQLALCSI